MIFETGKVYKGYKVESRTKCFVKFEGEAKKRHVKIFGQGQEYLQNDGGLIKAIEDVAVEAPATELSIAVSKRFNGATVSNIVIDDEFGCVTATVNGTTFVDCGWITDYSLVSSTPAETFFIPIVTMYDNRTVKNLPADHAHTLATPYKAPTVAYSEVEIMAASLGYCIINMGTPKKPMYRLMRDGLLIPSNLYNMGLALFDVRTYLEAERHEKRFNIHVESALEKQICPDNGAITTVVCNIPQCGYAVAVKAFPDWFYDDDNAHFNIDVERERMSRMWDRDCDRASSFSMSAKYGEGAVI